MEKSSVGKYGKAFLEKLERDLSPTEAMGKAPGREQQPELQQKQQFQERE